MSLIKGSINPLNVLESRKLSYIPEHFAVMSVNLQVIVAQLDGWIYENLDSRYAITKNLKIDSNNRIIEVYDIGVEDAKELTMLSLSCPHLIK